MNVAGGDIRISFDKNNAPEAIRARRIITEMLGRGYALLIEVEGAYQRAIAFDENVGEYIIVASFVITRRITAQWNLTDRFLRKESPQTSASYSGGRGQHELRSHS